MIAAIISSVIISYRLAMSIKANVKMKSYGSSSNHSQVVADKEQQAHAELPQDLEAWNSTLTHLPDSVNTSSFHLKF